MELVAFVGNDKENLGQVVALMNRLECEKVLLVKSSASEHEISNHKSTTLTIDTSKDILSLKKEMQDKLKPLLSGDFEVALSLASGTGKEHMALIGALLSIPVGIRIVVYTKNGVEFLT